MESRLRLYTLGCLSGTLMGVAWPYIGSATPLIFIAWVPLLLLERTLHDKMLRPRKLILPVYCAFFIFNLLTTWWIWFASPSGMAMAVLLNALLMTLVFYLFHLVHRRLGHAAGYSAFVTLWMGFELAHYYWELSWPWINMGNVFSIRTTWVQWYEYTGTGGGTLWILSVNLIFFSCCREFLSHGFSRKIILGIVRGVATIVIPVAVSLGIYSSYTEKKDPIDVVVVQPNIDPYKDKFRGMNALDQLTVFFRNAVQAGDSTAQFILGPETVLPYTIVENNIDRDIAVNDPQGFSNEFGYLRSIFSFMKKSEMVLGMSSKKYYPDNEDAPANAREDGPGMVSEYYNSSLYIEPGMTYHIYHKKFLVLGVEKIPFSGWIPALNDLALSLGGSSQTLGSSEHPEIFKSRFTKARITSAICYESIYNAHLAQAVRMGANVIFVMTNDGWWDDTPGYKQHFSYSRLRAIELRRSIARSANTGISGFIDQRGQIIKQTGWWESTALRCSINLNEELTFYARTGDLLYATGLFAGLGLVLVWLYFAVRGMKAGKTREI